MPLKKERTVRKTAVNCITEAGQELELPSPCVTHAVAIWYRYFTVRSLQKSDAFVLACACLLTASKAEDHPKSLQVSSLAGKSCFPLSCNEQCLACGGSHIQF